MRFVLLGMLLAACTVGEAGSGGPPGDNDDDIDNPPPGADAPAVATGSLEVTYTSTTRDGEYAPANVVAVWVESAGAFVKTIDRHSQVRTQHLVAWNQLAGAGDVDAVSGATRQNHATPVSVTWDLRDRANAEIPDGTYTVRMEMAEDNSNQPAQNNQGTFTFTKGAAPEMQTGLTNGGFTNVSISYTPAP
jgi:hypothetical protein